MNIIGLALHCALDDLCRCLVKIFHPSSIRQFWNWLFNVLPNLFFKCVEALTCCPPTEPRYTIVIHIFEFSLDVMKILLKLAVKRGFRANRFHSLYHWFKDTITSKVFGTKNLLVNDTVKFKIFASLFADFDIHTFCQSTVFISPGRGTISNKNRDCLLGNLTSLTAEQTEATKFVPLVWFLRLKVQ